MNYLQLAKEFVKTLAGTKNINHESEISDKSEKRAAYPETRFTKATDPYRVIGAKNYWKMNVPADQRPQWVKDEYGLD